MNALSARAVTKRFKSVIAVDDLSLEMEPGLVYGLLGRNGAGKSTFMSLASGQDALSSGSLRVFGYEAFNNRRALSSLCYVRENQKYPSDTNLSGILKSASYFYPHWDQQMAMRLVDEFAIPDDRVARKFSRGQLSALAVTIGLASRAPITFFDEPYLGLDSVARSTFYKNLATSQQERPRTVVLSSHLIDEVATLINHVFILQKGQLVLNASMDDIQERSFHVTGPAALVSDFLGDSHVYKSESLGGILRALVYREFDDQQRQLAATMGISIDHAGLQDLLEGFGK